MDVTNCFVAKFISYTKRKWLTGMLFQLQFFRFDKSES